jgi:hypothetical protein
MPNGDILDPRMNSIEKEYGILNTTEIGTDGKSKQIIYLKSKECRHLTAGTPVKFELEEREIPYEKGGKIMVKIEIATKVVVDEGRIKNHPVISKLNGHAKQILEGNYIAKALD